MQVGAEAEVQVVDWLAVMTWLVVVFLEAQAACVEVQTVGWVVAMMWLVVVQVVMTWIVVQGFVG